MPDLGSASSVGRPEQTPAPRPAPSGTGGARAVLPGTGFDAAGLLAIKGSRRISVVIPARDEEDSVGGIVATVRAELVERIPLVDELIVIDSDSVDSTARRAREAGASVHAAAQIRPDLGAAQGKGEALWKSQFVVTGDVIAFIDSDLVEWGTHFVTGLLGPLLTDERVQLVKAVYDRPHLDEHGQVVESGGRVTELVARPLLALHHPQLAHIIQPLSGEWAVRATALAQLWMPVGYGVEIAALIDIATRHGSDAVAQVELGLRTHRHHRHDTLGPMAVQVMAAAQARRAGREGEASVVELRQFDRAGDHFVPRTSLVDIAERPPYATVSDTQEVQR